MVKAVALISGGIDSPVAAHLVKKMGVDIIALHFSTELFAGKDPEIKARKLAKKIGAKKFISIDVSREFERIAKECNHKYYFVLIKRFMLKKAEVIAKKEKCDFIVTGESLGQVSSQTLSNLIAITKSVSMPILRPLLTFDKDDIVRMAEKIGTFEISKGPEVCDLLGPKHPATRSLHEKLIEEEKRLDASGGI